jgi:hypothetical protein
VDRDYLLMLMEYILGLQEEESGPYAPSLTDHAGDYWSLAGEDVTAGNTTNAPSIGDPAANSSEVKTINGEPYVPEEFMREHGPWMNFGTPSGVAHTGAGTSNNVTPGVSPPRIWEDGSVTPAGAGDTATDPNLLAQLISGPFQQFVPQSRPTDGLPRAGAAPMAMAALQSALTRAQVNGSRPASQGANLQYSQDAPSIFHRVPNPFGGQASIPLRAIPIRPSMPAAPLQGLFGASPPARASQFGAPATRVLNTSTRKLR